MEKIESFYKEYEDMFEEYLENSRRYLKDNNEKYAELKNEYNKILEQNENLTWILEGDIKGRNLSNEECFSLSKLVQIYYDIPANALIWALAIVRESLGDQASVAVANGMLYYPNQAQICDYNFG